MKNGVCLKLRGERVFENFTRAQMSTLTHSVKKTTELPCLGILKHGNYDLTIRWMYVLSSDTPTIVRAQPKTTRAGRGSDEPSCLGLRGGGDKQIRKIDFFFTFS